MDQRQHTTVRSWIRNRGVSTTSSCPNTRCTCSSSGVTSSINGSTRCTSGTFCEYLYDIIGVEAQLVRVLGVVGVQRSALGGPRLRLGGRFGPTGPGKRFHLLGPPALKSARKTQGSEPGLEPELGPEQDQNVDQNQA